MHPSVKQILALSVLILVLLLISVGIAHYNESYAAHYSPRTLCVGCAPTKYNETSGIETTPINSYNSPMNDSKEMLLCTAKKEENQIVISYTFTNKTGADVYVMDATPAVDSNHHVFLKQDDAVVFLGNDGWIKILKGLAPRPPYPVTHMIMPLAAKVPAGQSINRVLHIPLYQTNFVTSQPDRDLSQYHSLKETNPYYGELPSSQYNFAQPKGAVFSVEFLSSAAAGFEASVPAYEHDLPSDPGLFAVKSKNTISDIESVTCTPPLQDLTILKYPETSPR
jgi:hypothetical protein